MSYNNTLHIRARLRTDKKNKQGLCPLILDVHVNGSRTKISTPYKLKVDAWDQSQELPTRYHPQYGIIRTYIMREKATLSKKFLDRDFETPTPLHTDDVKAIVKEDKIANNFINIIDDFMSHQRNLRSPETMRQYLSEKNKLVKYAGNRINAATLDKHWIEKYQGYMSNILRNNPNTVMKSTKFIRTIFNYGKDAGLIKHYPFSGRNGVKVKFQEGTKVKLTLKEVQAFEQVLKTGKHEETTEIVGYFFLLGCYTGLRISDWPKLNSDQFLEGNMLVIKMDKTGYDAKVYVSTKVRELMLKVKGKTPPSQVHCNRIIRFLADIAGIEKPVSSHVARHSFGTICLDLGVPLETVQAAMGHQDQKITRIYSKLRDQKLVTDMKVWDKALKNKK